jgi:hypothetical protein
LKERDYTGSYSAVYRFVRKLDPRLPEATVRVERKPGEEGQVDFGYAGRMIDPETGELRKHGTTKEKPLVRFQEVEQSQLKPLPRMRYDLATWKVLKLHRSVNGTSWIRIPVYAAN